MWIEKLMRKRLAQTSTVAVIDSDDRFRLRELFSALCSTYETVLFWNLTGLYSVELDNGKLTLQKENEPPLLDHVLSKIYEKAKSKRMAVVIFPPDKNVTLNAYLKVFALDDMLYLNDFLCCVFGGKHFVNDDTLRLSILCEPPASTEEERKRLLEKLGFPYEETAIAAGAGLNLHEFETAALESMALHGNVSAEFVAKAKSEIVKKEGIMEIEEPAHGFEAIGGYEYLKQFVRENIINVLSNPKKAEALGLRPPRGLLLFGPPGTGKTIFARALAKELKIPLLRFKTEHVVSKWYGETERNVSKAIKLAESVAPCIVFIDEIDRFGKRDSGDHEVTRRTFSIILEWLGSEERKAIILGTTNVPEQLDDAFLRVGRFDYHIPVLYPDRDARYEILRVHTGVKRKIPIDENDYEVILDETAFATEFFSGAELEELTLRVSRYIFREGRDVATWSDFERAINTFSIDIEARKEIQAKYVELAKSLCNDREILSRIC